MEIVETKREHGAALAFEHHEAVSILDLAEQLSYYRTLRDLQKEFSPMWALYQQMANDVYLKQKAAKQIGSVAEGV